MFSIFHAKKHTVREHSSAVFVSRYLFSGEKRVKVTMKKHLIPLLALLLASLLGVFAFWIEMRQNELYGWYSGVVYARWCFWVIPALFFAWLFAFCRVRVRLWKWLVFALSYAVWFALLFAYPIFVIFFSTVFYLPEELIANG